MSNARQERRAGAVQAAGAGLPPIRSDVASAKADIAEYGLARIAGAITDQALAAARQRLVEQAQGEEDAGVAFRETGSYPATRGGPNQRVWCLVNKGEEFRALMANPVACEIARSLLGDDMIIHGASANIAGPGGEPQPLHADQNFAPLETPYPLMLNTVWMLDDFTEENGATRVVPGTHRVAAFADQETATQSATGPAGTLLLFEGRLWHGTGANRTAAPRHGVLIAYSSAFVRQNENTTLSSSPEAISRCSPELLRLLGFSTSKGLGWVQGPSFGAVIERPTEYLGELGRGADAELTRP